MNKYIIYVVLWIIALGIAYYEAGEMGLLGAGAVLFGSKIANLKKSAEKLDVTAQVLNQQIQDLEKKEFILKKEGVAPLTPEEEVEYWKKQ